MRIIVSKLLCFIEEMSLKSTEEFYKFVISQVVKEIGEDPQTNNISGEAIEYLEKVYFPE